MRHLTILLSLATAACSAAPGAPHTDITAATTEKTGPYDVVRRTVEGKRYTLQVEAAHPERAQTISDQLVEQMLQRSPDEVMVEVRPRPQHPGETTRIRWVRGRDVPASAIPQPADGTPPGDRIGNRATGQSGTDHDH